jgi:hypothetical protein
VQTYFNRAIRLRDSHDGVFTCISCEKTFPIEVMQAGHFFGTHSYNWMRYQEYNVHGQCNSCNGFSHESLIFYTLNIQKKIGINNFNKLLTDSKTKKPEFTRAYLNELLNKYKYGQNT